MAKKGYKQTDEHRKKSSEIRKGRKHPHKGRPLSEEHKRKLRESNLGKHHTEEHKRKISISSRKGENHWNWQGGKMKNYPENFRIRETLEYYLWRKAVFARDNFTCQKYVTKGGKLIAHHINNFADFPELRFAIDNGITFSKEAHDEFHKKYGKNNNTKEQLKEFLSS